jgi:hypothetical protein
MNRMESIDMAEEQKRLLISRLKVRFLPRSPFKSTAYGSFAKGFRSDLYRYLYL